MAERRSAEWRRGSEPGGGEEGRETRKRRDSRWKECRGEGERTEGRRGREKGKKGNAHEGRGARRERRWSTTHHRLQHQRKKGNQKREKKMQAHPTQQGKVPNFTHADGFRRAKNPAPTPLSLHSGIRGPCVARPGDVTHGNAHRGEGQKSTAIKGRNRKSPGEIRALLQRQFMPRRVLIQGVAALGTDRMTF